MASHLFSRSLFPSHFHRRPLQRFSVGNACISFLLSCHNWKMSSVNICPGCAWSYLPLQHLLCPFDKQHAALMHIEIPPRVFLKPHPLRSSLVLCCSCRSPTNYSVGTLGEHVLKTFFINSSPPGHHPLSSHPRVVCFLCSSSCEGAGRKGVGGGPTEEVVANPGKYCCFWCVAENPTRQPPPPPPPVIVATPPSLSRDPINHPVSRSNTCICFFFFFAADTHTLGENT